MMPDKRYFERGQVMAELVVLLPIYVLIILGVIYFADYGTLNKRAHFAARYAAWNSYIGGSGAAVSADTLKDKFFNDLYLYTITFNDASVGVRHGGMPGISGARDRMGRADSVTIEGALRFLDFFMKTKRAEVKVKYTPMAPLGLLEPGEAEKEMIERHVVDGRGIIGSFMDWMRRLWGGGGIPDRYVNTD